MVLPSILLRPHPGYLLVLGGSTLGGLYAYTSKDSDSAAASLNPHTFTPYTLAYAQPVSSTSSIFTLRGRTPRRPDAEDVADKELRDVERNCIWSVQVKQPQLQIARAYTPLPPYSASAAPADGANSTTPTTTTPEIRLLVRRERGGEVSNYIHRLPAQSTVELRGPNVEARIPDDVREVLFLAGGTGIAPAMQVAHVLGRRQAGPTAMHVLWANRRREECVGGVSEVGVEDAAGSGLGWGWGSGWWRRAGRLSGWRSLFGLEENTVVDAPTATPTTASQEDKGVIVQELERLKHAPNHSRLTVEYFVDEERTFIRPADVAKHLHLSSSSSDTDSDDSSKLALAPAPRSTHGSRVIFVSGPDGFIAHWAGPKVWADGRETQGPLGGVLGQMDLRGWKVFKL